MEKQTIEMLKNANDKTLSEMLNQRKGTNSDFKQAIINEMSRRCVKEYILRHGEEVGINKDHLDNKLEIIFG